MFLSELTVVCWLLAFHMTEGNIRLTISHQRINALRTKNFILTCKYEDKKSNILSLQLAKVIKKEAGRDVLKELVSMDEDSRIYIESPSPSVQYTGGIQGKGKVSLSGTWTRVPEDFGGIYQCHVNIIDDIGHLGGLNRQIQIQEESLSFPDSVAAIKELQTSVHKMQVLKETMDLAFNFVDGVMKASHSKTYKNKYYIGYLQGAGLARYAEAFCRARGGYLAELNDYNEWKFVQSYVSSLPPKLYYFISGRRNFANNKFYWPRIGKWTHAYVHWGKNQPNNHNGDQNCLAMDAEFQWRISDIGCFLNIGFICEMKRI